MATMQLRRTDDVVWESSTYYVSGKHCVSPVGYIKTRDTSYRRVSNSPELYTFDIISYGRVTNMFTNHPYRITHGWKNM